MCIRDSDKYVQTDSMADNYVKDLKCYSLVTNSAMFEHVISRSSLDEVNSCVKDDGVLMIHTRISEEILPDPEWFYLKPHVHTAFHTNMSMQILMKQWGYVASIYSPQAKSWFLFKEKYPKLNLLSDLVTQVNLEIQAKYLYFKLGFMDYWK